MSEQMTIHVRLFAGPAQQLGVSHLELHLLRKNASEQLCVGDVANRLCDQYPELASLIKRSRWAVGTDFVTQQQELTNRQTLALIPPVSGG
ncbi:MAG TPA: hypothetical protein DCF63_05995 [Planctomycetaceae bacterium]|nr:hypothetical protein [Planctomycetaceae bacterium]